MSISFVMPQMIAVCGLSKGDNRLCHVLAADVCLLFGWRASCPGQMLWMLEGPNPRHTWNFWGGSGSSRACSTCPAFSSYINLPWGHISGSRESQGFPVYGDTPPGNSFCTSQLTAVDSVPLSKEVLGFPAYRDVSGRSQGCTSLGRKSPGFSHLLGMPILGTPIRVHRNCTVTMANYCTLGINLIPESCRYQIDA